DSSEDEEVNEETTNEGAVTHNKPTKAEPKEVAVHMFCADCVRNLANAACVDTPLSKGAIGLRCMDTNCDNTLLLSDFRKFLPSDCLARLEERMQHETLIKAKIKNLERCLKCNYGQIMKTKPSQRRNLKFTCHECGESHCRLCKNPWKKLHAGRTCWQFRWAMHYRHGWDMTQTPDFVDDE
uniref:IBR domain-containing protein n=1 Tax=Panagrolaimus sp. JU765 TaxID=591449 RepID=A0AC34RT83_9BILA